MRRIFLVLATAGAPAFAAPGLRGSTNGNPNANFNAENQGTSQAFSHKQHTAGLPSCKRHQRAGGYSVVCLHNET
jgi:hypothetical protein